MSFFNQIKKIYASEFFKFSAVLLTSNVIAQIIGFVAYPIITRLYNPEVFGFFNFFLSIVSVLTLLTTGQYELAIILPKSEKKAVALFQLSLLLTVFFSLLFFIVVSLFGRKITSLFHQEQLVSLLQYLPLYLLLYGFWQSLNYYFVRQKKYYNLSVYNVVQSTAGSILKCFFGIKGFFVYGLVWGQLFGQFLATLISAISGKSFLRHLKQWDRQKIKIVAKTYSNFPKFQLPHALLNTLAGNLPILLLPFYFKMEMSKIGLFSLALSIGLVPVSLFSNSICQVLFRKMSERIQNKEKIMNDCILFCKMCVIFILPFFVFFPFIPNKFFGFLFGQHWIDVGFYLKLLLPCLFLSILVSSLSFIPDIFFKQKTAAIIELIYLILKTIAILLGVYFQSFNLAIIFYCVIVTFMLMVKLLWYFKIVRKYELSVEIKL